MKDLDVALMWFEALDTNICIQVTRTEDINTVARMILDRLGTPSFRPAHNQLKYGSNTIFIYRYDNISMPLSKIFYVETNYQKVAEPTHGGYWEWNIPPMWRECGLTVSDVYNNLYDSVPRHLRNHEEVMKLLVKYDVVPAKGVN